MTIKRKSIFITMALLALGVILVGVALAAPTEIDLTIADNTVPYNDAIFAQGPVDIPSAGTGVLDPFFSLCQGGVSGPICKGYNTVDASAEFDTITADNRTHPLLLSSVPEVEINGVFYREFKLDINKSKDGNPYLALNQLKLFLTDDPAITGYDYAGGTEFGANAVKVWDLGDAVVLMDYFLEAGSGASDLTFSVKSSLFDTPEDCSYGSPDCSTWLVMWNEFGNYSNSALYPSRTWENNAGFEEWGVVLRPVVDVDKTADGTFDRTIDWEITKSVLPAQHDLFAGGSGSSTYTIELIKSITDSNFAASGTITIFNPTGDPNGPVPEKVPAEILSVNDVIDQAGLTTSAMVNCGVTFPYTLAPGDTLKCTYTASTPNADDGLNTATVTLKVPAKLGGGTAAYEGTADLSFTASPNGFEEVNVDDTNDGGDGGPFSDSTSYTYDRDFTCSSDSADYMDGTYTETYPNTATIVETGQSDDASVTLNCYIPMISKTASASYIREYSWTITKGPNGDYFGTLGDSFTHDYTVSVDQTISEHSFGVNGSITVQNPNPNEAITVSVADVVDGTPATLDCAGSLTVPASSSASCGYLASLDSKTDGTNTATVTLNEVDFNASADYAFGDPTQIIGEESIKVIDTNGEEWTANSDDSWTYSKSFTCSEDESDYTDGKLVLIHPNTATIFETGQSSVATVTVNCFLDGLPSIEVTKTADPSLLIAPGGEVTFTVLIENTGPNAVIIDTLDDDIYGKLTDLSDEGGTAKPQTSTTCELTQTIPVGGSYTCEFTAEVTGEDGDSETDTVTASGEDEQGNPVSDDDDATVYINPIPIIEVTKTANPVELIEPGGKVTFTVLVENAGPNAVIIDTLDDNIYGDLTDISDEGGTAKPQTSTTCELTQTIADGGSYTCEFTAVVTGGPGSSETDTVTASGEDVQGIPVSDDDDATVIIRDQLYKVFLPMVFKPPPPLPEFRLTLGYEDLEFDNPRMDFDYNDWVINVTSDLDLVSIGSDMYEMSGMTFEITPRARGGVYDHVFHIDIPGGIFASDADYTLTIKDQNNNVVSTEAGRFNAAQGKDFLVIPCTCEAFPPPGRVVNVIEGTPEETTRRTSELRIVFDSPVLIDRDLFSPEKIGQAHGEGLFFDPYIYVEDTKEEIHQGDFRLLNTPDLDFEWAEERVRLDRAYPAVIVGADEFFPFGWWENHTSCVYGDGIVCPAP